MRGEQLTLPIDQCTPAYVPQGVSEMEALLCYKTALRERLCGVTTFLRGSQSEGSPEDSTDCSCHLNAEGVCDRHLAYPLF